MNRNEDTNRREKVDTIVRNLSRGDVNPLEVQSSLMKSFKNLENSSFDERNALQEILASNVLLSKAVGTLLARVIDVENRNKALEDRLKRLENRR